jgi:radical SAM protein with 4Fe4S-binding SPASM domain
VLDRFNAEAVLINFDEVNGIEVKEYLNFFATSTIRTIELSFKNEIVFDKIDFNKLLKIYPRIKRVYIYNSLTTGSNHIYNDCYILRYKDEYVELKKRLKQKESFFTINNRLFLESQTYNPYFNGKLYVDGNGDIFNAPETRQCFGNINNLKELADVFLSNAFQKYWKVKKDICDVCKHCEFRYMCIDNRLPVRRLVGEWHYESECDYNPYIGKWQGEEGYRSLEKCGVVSNEKEFSIDHDKTAAINQELWRD